MKLTPKPMKPTRPFGLIRLRLIKPTKLPMMQMLPMSPARLMLPICPERLRPMKLRLTRPLWLTRLIWPTRLIQPMRPL
jgi:hypothetical protein